MPTYDSIIDSLFQAVRDNNTDAINFFENQFGIPHTYISKKLVEEFDKNKSRVREDSEYYERHKALEKFLRDKKISIEDQQTIFNYVKALGRYNWEEFPPTSKSFIKAIKEGSLTTEILLKMKIKPDSQAMVQAVYLKNTEIMNLLHNFNAPIDEKAILMAIALGHTKHMQILYKWNAPISQKAMELAAKIGRLKTIKILLKWNLSITQKVILEASTYGHRKVLDFFIFTCNFHIDTKLLESCIKLAASNGYINTIEFLYNFLYYGHNKETWKIRNDK